MKVAVPFRADEHDGSRHGEHIAFEREPRGWQVLRRGMSDEIAHSRGTRRPQDRLVLQRLHGPPFDTAGDPTTSRDALIGPAQRHGSEHTRSDEDDPSEAAHHYGPHQ